MSRERAAPSAPFDREGATGDHRAVRPLRILVIEDDPDILHALTFALGDGAYEVTGVDNGIDAIVLLGLQRFDLVVLDLYLPGIDGEAILTTLRAKDVRTPIVIASASKSIESTALAFGVAGFLRKPFSLPALEAMIAQAVAPELLARGGTT